MRLKNKGTTTLELALLFPILVVLFFALIQIVIFLQSSTITHYAAFVAGRAYQVYGDQKLSSIKYPHVGVHPYTNDDQTIAEAAAEKVIFESLMWEQSKIEVSPKSRLYKDGNDLLINGASHERSEGVVRVNLQEGATVTYCLPIVFPGAALLFESVKKYWPCKTTRFGTNYAGIGITRAAKYGREPEEQ